MNQKNYLNYIHYFRGFAILIIVAIHCRISLGWGENEFGQQVFTTLLDNGTMLFVFIAGFLFHYLKNKFEYRSYLNRKAKYVLLPYIIMSFFPIVLKVTHVLSSDWIPPGYLPDNPWEEALYYFSTGKHLGPFWFIPMIVIFYFISPLLIRIDQPKFYTFVFPFIFIGSLFTYKFGYFSNIWASFVHFLPVYIFGMWAANYREKLTRLSLPVTGLLILIYLTLTILEINHVIPAPKIGSFYENELSPFFAFNIVKIRVYILCIILLRVFYQFNNRNMPMLKLLGDYSFGVYFVHIFFIIIIQYVINAYLPEFTLNTFTFLLYVAFVSLLSLAAVRFVKWIAGKNSRMLIGS
ncbi:acyltransferase family protein [Fulvivirga sedimenti]|uniref:Acyltransferase n=1 Tax=Fulvivirga sedimenti TaxID=2879465 RepID=A0A9X1HUY3_9BACT|nr:acyltransferase [Fulvivirga sedimenti]